MHNVTERDGVFTVRGPAWWDTDGSHDLDEYPTREEAQAIAHPWEPVSEPIFRRVLNSDLTSGFEEVPGQVLNVRSDDGHPLGVVSDTFVPVNNSEMYDIAEVIQGEAGDVKFETGGSLGGGKKVWLLLRLNEPLTVVGDPNGASIPYFGLQNSHDGSGSFRGQGLVTRIVCDNTAQMADMEAKKNSTEFTFRHSKNVKARVEEAKEALAGWREGIEKWKRLSEHLVTLEVTPEQRELFIREFVPMPVSETLVSDRVVTNIEAARQSMRDILAGPTTEGISNTAYGLVQASVEYGQHVRKAQSRESRFRRAYLDRDRLTADAVELAQEVTVA